MYNPYISRREKGGLLNLTRPTPYPSAYCLFELREELPSVICCECLRCALVLRLRSVVAVESNPGNGVSGCAAVIHRLDVCPASLGRLGSLLCGAPVVLEEAVAHLATPRDGEDRVVDSVFGIVGYGIGAGAGTGAADLRVPREHGDGAEVLAKCTGQDERHGGAVAEAGREAEVRVDAQVVFHLLDGRLDELDVRAARVPPAAVETRRRDVDGPDRVVDEGRQAVPREVAALSDGDLLAVAAERVQRQDQTVLVLVVVVLGKPHVELARLAARGQSQGRASRRGRDDLRSIAAASRGRASRDRLRSSYEEERDIDETRQPAYHVGEFSETVRARWRVLDGAEERCGLQRVKYWGPPHG